MNDALNIAINFIIALALVSVVSAAIPRAERLYYKYADIDNFYVATTIEAPDVCVGDATQRLISDRRVLKTDVGYNAYVVRELFLLGSDTSEEYYKESKDTFIQASTNGSNPRTQHLPTMKVGQYIWVLYITLYVNGVERNDVPPLLSNTFNVTLCA
jgi:hypothetical protein